LRWSDAVLRSLLNTGVALLRWSSLLLSGLLLNLGRSFRLVTNGGSVSDGMRAAAVTSQSQKKFALLQSLQIISIVVFTSFNALWVSTLTAVLISTNLVNSSDGTSVLTRAVIKTDVVFTTVFGVSVTGESSWVGVGISRWALESSLGLGDFAFRYLISPHAHTSLTVVGKARSTGVLVRVSVPTAPEDVAKLLIGEDTIQSWAVGAADWGLQFRP